MKVISYLKNLYKYNQAYFFKKYLSVNIIRGYIFLKDKIIYGSPHKTGIEGSSFFETTHLISRSKKLSK